MTMEQLPTELSLILVKREKNEWLTRTHWLAEATKVKLCWLDRVLAWLGLV